MVDSPQQFSQKPGSVKKAGWCPLLYENAAVMDSSLNVDDLLLRLAKNMAAAAGTGSCIILLPEKHGLLKVAMKYGTEDPGISQFAPEGAIARAIKIKKPLQADASKLGLTLPIMSGDTNFICVPLVSHDNVAGIAILFSAGSCSIFTPDSIELLYMMGVQGAHAIDEYRMREGLRKRNEELSRVYEIQKRITQSIDLEKATESIVENAPYITKLQYCMIYLLDPNLRHIVSVKAPASVEKQFGHLQFNLDDLIASKIAIDERKPLFIEHAPDYPDIAQYIVNMLGMRSAVVLPLIARDKVLGVMWLYTTDREVSFDEDDMRSAIALSDQAAVVIDNARIYRELQESYVKLKDLDSMKMEFFTLISHELRNPLAVIKGFTELIYDGTLGPINNKQKDKLEKIRENVDKLADMIGKMSDISSLESRRYPVEKTPVIFSEIVSELMDTMGFLFRNKQIELKTDIPDSLPLVEVDRKKLEQVILNLLNNALKYTPEGRAGHDIGQG